MNVVRRVQTTGEPALLRITAAQFSVMVEAGAFTGARGVELRGGLLYEMNPRYVPHLLAKGALYEALLDALRALGSPLRVSSEGSVLLGDRDVPMPDIIVWEPLRGRGPVPGERERIVAEVSDTTLTDDLGHKRALYAAAAVPEYWVVDLPGRAVHQYWAPVDGAYARSADVPFGGTLRSATLAGLAVPTAALDDGEEGPG
jgi:Uma2 family endonuclease